MKNDLRSSMTKLLAYCEANDWAGYEPYDVLNSSLFEKLPVLDNRIARLVMTQAFKRSPLNLRGLIGVLKTQNPKALGLFLSSFVKIAAAGIALPRNYSELMVEKLEALRSKDTSYWCWGYNFPWQTRTVLVPRWFPNLVCTSFAATGLLDAYEHSPNPEYLEMAHSAARYILDQLYWTEGESVAGFAYPLPSVRNQVYNANLLAAALFCRIYGHCGDRKFLEAGLRAARYCVSKQQPDGSWFYGEAATQRWIDNFHTGFNLSALHSITQYASMPEFEGSVSRGLEFYRKHFFRKDGAVGYFHNQMYPIDTHCIAQSVITLIDLKHLDATNVETATSVMDWALAHMWDERGFFYYRKLRTGTIRTSYMRWTQAWMFLAIAMLLSEIEQVGSDRKQQSQIDAVPARSL